MLRPRIIPCLLVHKGGLVKTIEFKDPKYVGDPINAVRIFNEKEADEIIVLDIDATRHNAEPDYKKIALFAAECRMPMCYGGGVRNVEHAKKIVELGVEKVSLSAGAIENPGLVSEIAEQTGRQSVVVTLDVRKSRAGNYEIWTHNATTATGRELFDTVAQMEELGAGEIVVNSIDNDGKMTGYDLELLQKLRDRLRVPYSILGGAGSITDIGEAVAMGGAVGAAAGSLFVFKGKYRAVLISYPDFDQKNELVYSRL